MSEEKNDKSIGVVDVAVGTAAAATAGVVAGNVLKKQTLDALDKKGLQATGDLVKALTEKPDAAKLYEEARLAADKAESVVKVGAKAEQAQAAFAQKAHELRKMTGDMPADIRKNVGEALEKAEARNAGKWAAKVQNARYAELAKHGSEEVRELAKLEDTAMKTGLKVNAIENAGGAVGRGIAVFKGMGVGGKVAVALGAALVGIGIGKLVHDWRAGGADKATPEQTSNFNQLQQELSTGRGRG